jgi:hypothetical protein
VTIPASPEITPTRLEVAKVKNCICFEQELSKVSPCLHGFARESFLTDNAGLPCLANSEAEWHEKVAGTNKQWELHLLPTDRKLDYDYMEWSVPVCMDGILVAGTTGRPSFRNEVRMRLGNRNSNIPSSSPALIDARGDLKPEITPGRTPPDHFYDFPKWKRLAEAFIQGQGLR